MPGDDKVARIARKISSGLMENNMAENWGKRFHARTISVLFWLKLFDFINIYNWLSSDTAGNLFWQFLFTFKLLTLLYSLF